MKKQLSLLGEFTKGVWDQNPVMKQVLGMCPVLAVTTTAMNGIAMGLATTFVLTSASFIISLVRKLIPNQVRIAAFILIISTFVTIVDIVMKAKFPEMSKALGAFIPLIIVNCLILGRQEAFSSKNPIHRSVIDALGMGLGFILTLFVLGGIREILGTGTLLGMQAVPDGFETWVVMILPAGAFLTLGFLFGLSNAITQKRKRLENEIEIREYLKSQNIQTADLTEEA